MSAMSEGMMIAWSKFGLRLMKVDETSDQLTVWISVPNTSHLRNVKDEEMANMTLAKRFKTALLEMGVKRLTVKVKVRTDDDWTEEKANAEVESMKIKLFGSQH